MIQNYYDLQNTINSILQNITESNRSLIFKHSNKQSIKHSNKQSIKHSNKQRKYFNTINSIYSNIKMDLISKGYLDYINKPNYSLLLEENLENENDVIFIELYNLAKIENCITPEFFTNFMEKILKLEDIKFSVYLQKIKNNDLFLFHINYDFIRAGIQTILNNENSYLYFNKILNLDTDLAEVNARIKETLSLLNIYNNPNYINLKEFQSEYEHLFNMNEEYIKELEYKLSDLKDTFSLKDILQDKEKNFIKKIERDINYVEKNIEIFKQQNNIQGYLDKKSKISYDINVIKNQLSNLEKEINYYQNDNIENAKQINLLKVKNYQIREINNNSLNIRIKEVTKEEDYGNCYYDEVKLKTVKIRNQIKEIQSKIDSFIAKQTSIKNKQNIVCNTNPEKKVIIQKRYQRIIDNYQEQINTLLLNKSKVTNLLKEKEEVMKNQLKNQKEIKTENQTENQTFNTKLLSIKNLISEAKIDKNTLKSKLKDTISDNNNYIIENQKILKNLAINLEEEFLNLSNLEKEYEEIYKTYDDYNNQKDSLYQSKEILLDIEVIKKKYELNLNICEEYVYNSVEKYKNSFNEIFSKTEDNFFAKLAESINNVLKIQEIITINKVFNPTNLAIKYDLFNLNLLAMIDINRNKFKQKTEGMNSEFKKSIIKYNKSRYQLIRNNINSKKINDISIVLEKMIYILE